MAGAFKPRWVIGPAADISVLIAAPLAIVPLFNLLMGIFPIAAMKLGILGISATGHHLPGLIRAYTDKAIFRQFKTRLILVPFLFIVMTSLTAYFKLSLAFFVLIVWSTWHGSMQILGFLRIYDVKAGFQSAVTARLDFWMCLAWFIQVVLWSPSRKTSVFSSFYLAGGPLVPVPWLRFFEMAWLALLALVTAAYVFNTVRNRVKHGYLNFPKLLCLVASVGFWAYCMMSVSNLIIGLIMWEIFHDLQYNVFVWNYNRARVARDLSQSRIERFLFQVNWAKIALYTACIAAYGCIGLLSRDLVNVYQNERTYGNLLFRIGNVFAASGLIHFYLDGFIWKVRDGKVRQDLGMAANEGFRKRPTAVHGILVTLFFSAAALLAISEYRHANAFGKGSQTDNLADLIPGSGYANFMKASRLKVEGRIDSALIYYERAIRSDSAYAFSHAFIADLKGQAGDLPGAIFHYEKALASDPGNALIQENLANLYLQTGNYPEAKARYLGLLATDPGNAAFQYQVAWTLLQMKKGLEAKPYLVETLRLDPAQPKALNYLGMVEQAQGNLDSARLLYRKSLDLDSTYQHARENLSASGP